MKTVAISGYFDPLHVGHIELINQAAKLGDELIVIVNNDDQATLKKGRPFMNQDDRANIVANIKSVDEVVLSIDYDKSVCRTLKLVKPDVFAQGGDRHDDEVPEKGICKELGIKMIDGLGDKIRSSSDFTGLT